MSTTDTLQTITHKPKSYANKNKTVPLQQHSILTLLCNFPPFNHKKTYQVYMTKIHLECNMRIKYGTSLNIFWYDSIICFDPRKNIWISFNLLFLYKNKYWVLTNTIHYYIYSLTNLQSRSPDAHWNMLLYAAKHKTVCVCLALCILIRLYCLTLHCKTEWKHLSVYI